MNRLCEKSTELASSCTMKSCDTSTVDVTIAVTLRESSRSVT